MVEDVFAIGMALAVQRHGGAEAAGAILQDGVAGLPAAAAADRSAGLQRLEEGVADERVVGAGAAVPVLGRNAADAVDQPQGQRFGISHGGAAALGDDLSSHP